MTNLPKGSIVALIRLYCTLGGYLNRKMGTAIFFD